MEPKSLAHKKPCTALRLLCPLAILVALSSNAGAQLSDPPPVPSGVTQAAADSLNRERSVLLNQLSEFNRDLAVNKSNCQHADTSNAAVVSYCNNSNSRLQSEQDAYYSALALYKQHIAVAEPELQSVDACAREAGEAWKTDRRNCAYEVQGAFAEHGNSLGDQARKCLTDLGVDIGTDRVSVDTLTSCGATAPTLAVLSTAVDRMNACYERALVSQKQRKAHCQK